jgi:hypothetical protein
MSLSSPFVCADQSKIAKNIPGPKTSEGKANSSGNAVKHGYTSKQPQNDLIDLTTYEIRLEDWMAEYSPQTKVGEYYLRQMVVTTLKIESCEEDLLAIVKPYASRAVSSWEEVLAVNAAELLAKIAKSPDVIAKKLMLTLHGCRALLTEWRVLGESLFKTGVFGEDERNRALDLLGCNAQFRQGQTPIDPPTGHSDPKRWINDRMLAEANRLDARIQDGSLSKTNDLERRRAIGGYGLANDPEARKLYRYERELQRRFYKELTEYRIAEGLLAIEVPGPIVTPQNPDLVVPEPVDPSDLSDVSVAPNGPKSNSGNSLRQTGPMGGLVDRLAAELPSRPVAADLQNILEDESDDDFDQNYRDYIDRRVREVELRDEDDLDGSL